jgi:hypothetical protein
MRNARLHRSTGGLTAGATPVDRETAPAPDACGAVSLESRAHRKSALSSMARYPTPRAQPRKAAQRPTRESHVAFV